MTMELKRTFSLILLVSLSLLVADVHAGWKFWKKDTTTTTPTTILPITESTPAPAGKPNLNSAIAGAANPGLAIGVGATGEGVRQNSRPQRPNPGTEVGLDIPVSKPNKPGTGGTNGQGYRDWAIDLTGAGDPGRPGLPSQGPALTPGGQQPSPDSRPAVGAGQGYPSGSLPGSPTAAPAQRPGSSTGGSVPAQRPGSPTGGSVPAQRPGSPTGGSVPAQRPGSPNNLPDSRTDSSVPLPAPGNAQPGGIDPSGRPQVSTLHVGTLKPTSSTTPSPLRPGQSGSGSPSAPSSPTGGKTFAEAVTGGSRPGSPTPSARQPGHAAPPQPAQGQRRPPSPGQSTGQTQPSTGTIAAAGGALAGGALAGGAIAAGNANGAGTTGGSSATTNTRPKVYTTNPTYSKGNTVTDEDLEKLSEALFLLDTNLNRHVTLNLQKQTTSSYPVDEAPQPLFSVNANAFQANTVQKVLTIYDNYKLDTKTNEHLSPLQRAEESLLIDTFLSTNVMSAAMRFLADKSFIRKDYYEYKDALRRLWFDLFSRGEGRIGSTGFEHVFLSELKTSNDGTEVLGLHNWIYYSKQEAENRANYLGYIKKVDLDNKGAIVKIHTTFNGHDKPVTTMFVGTSPELEMALYTVCFYARPEQACPVSLGGTKFNIVTHNFKYRGKDHIGSAYPDI